MNEGEKISIAVPYVQGDFEGKLTDSLVQEITSSGLFKYANWTSTYRLDISIDSDHNEKIGYQYDRDLCTGTLQQNLLSSEGRRTITAKVLLFHQGSEKPILGPYKVTAYSEYDYINPNSINELSFCDPQCMRQVTLDFTLGQLDSRDSAQDNALVPLYHDLAHNIVQSLIVGLTTTPL